MSQQLVILWAVLAISQGIYLLVPAPDREGGASIPEVLPLALGAVALVQGIGIVGLLRIFLFTPIQTGRLDPSSKTGAVRLFRTLVMAWVLAESIAIYGLLLRLLHFEWSTVAPFAAAAALLLFFGRPWGPRLRVPVSASELASSSRPLR